ncbi:MAG: hypothetical protein SFW63_08525 [Alphaproteobacteria bacterium]|nr:hypothetical protein [Alphaproteobacteria bacterium]
MNKRIITWLILSLISMAPSAFAIEAPVLFRREEIIIRRAQPVPEPALPWQAPGQQVARPDIRLDTEIRDAASLVSQNGWFNLSSPADNQAVMLIMPQDEIAIIPPSSQFAPLDILMVDKEGVIREIYPRLKLAELTEPISSQTAIRALLFLRGGAHETLVIKPGDMVLFDAFTRPPATLSLPAPAAANLPAPPTPTNNNEGDGGP